MKRSYFVDKAGLETKKDTKEKQIHFEAIQFSRKRLNNDQKRLIEEEKLGEPTVIKHLQMIGFKYCKRDKHDDFEILEFNYAFISKLYAHFEQLNRSKDDDLHIKVSFKIMGFPVIRMSEKLELVKEIKEECKAQLKHEKWFNESEMLGSKSGVLLLPELKCHLEMLILNWKWLTYVASKQTAKEVTEF